MFTQTPTAWPEYQLIDSGGFEKLERFGKFTLIRPEPQAIWPKAKSDHEWRSLAHARFVRPAKLQGSLDVSVREFRIENITRTEEGWSWLKGGSEIPADSRNGWKISFSHGQMKLTMRLHFTSFGHIGIFPEQTENWRFLYDTISSWQRPGPVLNLFAYTGGASLAARAAGVDLVHVDAVKKMVTWANENQELSGLSGSRWVVEDAMKFVKKEVKRGRKYNGIILDPPAYGRGPEGEKWILEDSLSELAEGCSKLLAPKDALLILNLYSMGLSPLVALNVVKVYFKPASLEYGEFYHPSATGQKLPAGIYLRFRR